MATTFDDLLDSVVAKLVAISEQDSDKVTVGRYGSVALSQLLESTLYHCEVVPVSIVGNEYIDQRNIRSDYTFEVRGHRWMTTVDRVDGDDIKAIENLAADMRTAIYGFHDDASAPCAGFEYVNPDFDVALFYQEFDSHINSAIMKISVRATNSDTTT